MRKSGRKLKSLFYLTIIVVLCIFFGGCNKKGEITFEQAADEVFSEEISNQSEVGESKETERMKAGGTDVETDAWIYVDVAGAVRTPGVVKLARGARVYEAIELAGGFAKDAAISAVNQASVLQDGQQLYIVTVEEQKTKQLSGGTDVETDAWIYVDVAGAVRTPGVVKLARGARVYEAIELAGGFAKDAAISAVNQASVLQDGQQLYIVTVEEQKTKQLSSSEVSLETSGEGRVADAGKVNINQASEEELMTLPGIGASKAADIVRYREEQGRFEQIEDIMNISGIKEAVFGKIKDKITVQQ